MSEEKNYDEQEVRNHILILIGADDGPVKGKTMFVYQMFIIFKEISPEDDPSFFPYQFGPYSTAVAHECNWLIDNKLITATKEGRGWKFELTDKGKSSASSLTMPKTKKTKIAQLKKDTHDYGLKSTTKLLKTKYPQYFVNSRV